MTGRKWVKTTVGDPVNWVNGKHFTTFSYKSLFFNRNKSTSKAYKNNFFEKDFLYETDREGKINKIHWVGAI